MNHAHDHPMTIEQNDPGELRHHLIADHFLDVSGLTFNRHRAIHEESHAIERGAAMAEAFCAASPKKSEEAGLPGSASSDPIPGGGGVRRAAPSGPDPAAQIAAAVVASFQTLWARLPDHDADAEHALADAIRTALESYR